MTRENRRLCRGNWIVTSLTGNDTHICDPSEVVYKVVVKYWVKANGHRETKAARTRTEHCCAAMLSAIHEYYFPKGIFGPPTAPGGELKSYCVTPWTNPAKRECVQQMSLL